MSLPSLCSILILFDKLNNLKCLKNCMKSNATRFNLIVSISCCLVNNSFHEKVILMACIDRLARTSINSSPPAVNAASSNSEWNACFPKSSQLCNEEQATPSIFPFWHSCSPVWNRWPTTNKHLSNTFYHPKTQPHNKNCKASWNNHS